MSIKTVNELEWHDGKEIPNPFTGSFLILTKNGGIAEAEYKNNQWLQYRWEVIHKDVIAWCRLELGSLLYSPVFKNFSCHIKETNHE